MKSPIAYAYIFGASGAVLAALMIHATSGETCYWKNGEEKDGQFILFDEPRRVCESRDGDGSFGGRSLRTGSSSRSSGGWFRK